MPTTTAYSRTQKRLHWAIAALVAAQYLGFDGIARAFGRGMDAGVLPYTAGVVGHIVAGTLILLMTAWRLAIKLGHGSPPPPAAEPRLAALGGKAAHRAFYGILLAMPLSGLLAWFLPSEAIGGLHDLGQTALLWLIGLHVAAVLVHQLWWRTGLIARMT